MKRDEFIKNLLQFVNYHDGGYLEPYVADKLSDWLVDNMGMLAPPLEEDIYVNDCDDKYVYIKDCKWEEK